MRSVSVGFSRLSREVLRFRFIETIASSEMAAPLIRTLSIFIRARRFLDRLGIRLRHFVFAGILSLLTVCFEALSVGLLIPLAQGVIEMDFRFAGELPLLGRMIAGFPSLFYATNASVFILLVLIIFSAAMLRYMFDYAAQLSIGFQIGKFDHEFRNLIFGRYLTFGKLFFDRVNMGYLQKVLLRFTHEMGSLLSQLHAFFLSALLLFAYLFLMFRVSWKLTLLSLTFFPILYWSLTWLVKKIKLAAARGARASIQLSERVVNILLCIPLVKVYSREQEERKQFSNVSEAVWKLGFDVSKKQQLVSPLHEMIKLVVLLLLISTMAFLFLRERSGELSGYLVYFVLIRRALDQFASLNKFRTVVAKLDVPIMEIRKILSDEDKFYVTSGTIEFPGLKHEIELDHLSYSYVNAVPVLKDLSFSMEQGKTTALVGPTGAGKTTVISLILRFYESPPASIKIDGIDVRDYSLDSLRRHMSVVTQDVLLFNGSLRNNLNYGLAHEAGDDELLDVLKKARLHDFVMKYPERLDLIIGDRGVKLSGGEKQRLSIARAILKGSEIVILDEATSALDSKTERLIQEAIDEAIQGRTAIVIAHRLSTIRHADKIIVIEDGRWIEEGSLEELLSRKGKFYEYWNEQKFF